MDKGQTSRVLQDEHSLLPDLSSGGGRVLSDWNWWSRGVKGMCIGDVIFRVFLSGIPIN